MQKLDRILIEYFGAVSAGAGVGTFDPDTVPEEDWAQIFDIAAKDRTYGLIYYALKDRTLSEPLREKLNVFMKRILLSGVDEEKKLWQMRQLNEAFDKAGMKRHLFLKGFALKRLYRNSEVRSMSDIDVFVPREEFEAAQRALAELGYRQEEEYENNLYHFGYKKSGAALVELHFELGIRTIIPKRVLHLWYEDIFKNSVEMEFKGLRFRTLGSDDAFIHLLIHMGNHLLTGNCELRQLIDLAVFLSQTKLDPEYLRKWTPLLNVSVMADIVFCFSRNYFGVDVPGAACTAETERVTELLCSDIFEKNTHRLTLKHVPSYRFALTYKTPFVKPLLWIQEYLRGVFFYRRGPIDGAREASEICRAFYGRKALLNGLGFF